MSALHRLPRPAPSVRRRGEGASDAFNGAALRLRWAPENEVENEKEAERSDAIRSRVTATAAAPGRTAADIDVDYLSPATVGVFQRSRRKKRREERLRPRPQRSPPEVDITPPEGDITSPEVDTSPSSLPPEDETTLSSSPSMERLSGTSSFNDEEKRYDGQCVLVFYLKVFIKWLKVQTH